MNVCGWWKSDFLLLLLVLNSMDVMEAALGPFIRSQTEVVVVVPHAKLVLVQCWYQTTTVLHCCCLVAQKRIPDKRFRNWCQLQLKYWHLALLWRAFSYSTYFDRKASKQFITLFHVFPNGTLKVRVEPHRRWSHQDGNCN